MTAAASLSYTYAEMAHRETATRIRVMGVTQLREAGIAIAREAIQSAIDFLEESVALAAYREAAEELGKASAADILMEPATFLERARSVARLDVETLLARYAKRVNADEQPRPPTEQALPAMDLYVSIARQITAWPIDSMEHLAHRIGEPQLGYRARTAYSWICAFVRRHSAGNNRAERVAARAFCEGRLSLQEVAELWENSLPDALAWLDEHGFSRDLATLRLEPDARSAALARLRVDRLARDGQPVLQRELVVRDVLSSQRIEEVDARRWMNETR